MVPCEVARESRAARIPGSACQTLMVPGSTALHPGYLELSTGRVRQRPHDRWADGGSPTRAKEDTHRREGPGGFEIRKSGAPIVCCWFMPMTNGRKTRRLSYWGGGAALITLIWSTAIYCRFESSEEWASLRNELQEQNALALEVGTVNEMDLLFSGFNHASYDLSAEIKARVRVRGSAGSAEYRIQAQMEPNHRWKITTLLSED